MDDFEKNLARSHAVKASTIKQHRAVSRRFLLALEDIGIFSPDVITPASISEQITTIARRHAGGLRTVLFSIRAFLEYLYAHGDTTMDLSLAVPKFFAPRRKIYEGFSGEEIDRLLSASDANTFHGKRDYAILILAFQTGLRSCDIANLKRQDVCWHTNEIKIAQAKTELS